jgi:predicted ABC-type ATPase
MPSAQGGLWLFAGCNGAGKSTFIGRATAPGGIISGAEALNPDQLTKHLLEAEGYHDYKNVPADLYAACFRRAASALEETACEKLKAKDPVCIETVLSTDKYLRLVDVALQANVSFNLVYVALNSPGLSRQRVADRVARGGHPVPDDKIEPRYHRSMDNFALFAGKATHFWLYDNSDSTKSHNPILLFEGGRNGLTLYDRKFEPWAVALLVKIVGD